LWEAQFPIFELLEQFMGKSHRPYDF